MNYFKDEEIKLTMSSNAQLKNMIIKTKDLFSEQK
jgi:hypothetical protein